MQRFRIVLVLLALLALVFQGFKTWERMQSRNRAASLYGGAPGMDVLQKPDRTTVWRLKPAGSGAAPAASRPAATDGPRTDGPRTDAVEANAAEKPAAEKPAASAEKPSGGAAATGPHPGYVESGLEKAVPPELAARLGEVLASPESYGWDYAKGAPRGTA